MLEKKYFFKKGFTLIELLIAITISTMLLGGVFYIFSSGQTTYNRTIFYSMAQRDFSNFRRVFNNTFKAASPPTAILTKGGLYEFNDTNRKNFGVNFKKGTDAFNFDPASATFLYYYVSTPFSNIQTKTKVDSSLVEKGKFYFVAFRLRQNPNNVTVAKDDGTATGIQLECIFNIFADDKNGTPATYSINTVGLDAIDPTKMPISRLTEISNPSLASPTTCAGIVAVPGFPLGTGNPKLQSKLILRNIYSIAIKGYPKKTSVSSPAAAITAPLLTGGNLKITIKVKQPFSGGNFEAGRGQAKVEQEFSGVTSSALNPL